MTRVLLVSPVARPGGAERALTALARRLPSRGFEPEALLLEHGPLEKWLADAGCPTRVMPAGRLRNLPRTIRTVGEVRRAVRASRAEVIVANHSKGHIYGGLASLAAGVPSIWWQHGIPRRCAMETVAAAVPSAVVVCGSAAAAAAQRRITRFRSLVTIHPGVPVEEIASRRGSGAAVRHSLGWEGTPVVGTIGRLQPGKGQEVFLRAAAMVSRERPDARFVVIGGAVLGWEGNYPERLRSLTDRLGLTQVVHFAGHQPDVYPWIDALDVAVQPSFGESFGLAVVEAMALGKPVVATAAGGPAEIVEDGTSGRLVPPGRPDAMAEAILIILGRDEAATDLGREALRRARDFTDQKMAAEFASLLRGLQDGKRRS